MHRYFKKFQTFQNVCLNCVKEVLCAFVGYYFSYLLSSPPLQPFFFSLATHFCLVVYHMTANCQLAEFDKKDTRGLKVIHAEPLMGLYAIPF